MQNNIVLQDASFMGKINLGIYQTRVLDQFLTEHVYILFS